jgi:hypothetical protein
MDQPNQPDQPDQPKEPDVKIVHCEPPGGACQVYANHIQLSWTAHDVQFRYSHNHRLPEEPPTNRLEHRATVTLAWSEAKALLAMLADLIPRYEKANGEIIFPATLP